MNEISYYIKTALNNSTDELAAQLSHDELMNRVQALREYEDENYRDEVVENGQCDDAINIYTDATELQSEEA